MVASNGEFRRFVVDASVAAKWFLKDESEYRSAELLLADFREHRIQLLAPAHLHYEVSSAIRNAVRTRRLSVDDAREAIEIFLAWNIETVSGVDLILAGFDLSMRFGGSLYDGIYLALAEATASPLIYADARLRNAIGDHFSLALWLTDYVPVGREG
jgi:predicted nucleic acid-binding protein